MTMESAYHSFLKTAFFLLNPMKKMIIKTECAIHIRINQQALTILKHDGYERAFHFYERSLEPINQGAVWADQDFKSSNHFYHPYKKKEVYMVEAMHCHWPSITMQIPFSIGSSQNRNNPCFIWVPHFI